MTKKLLDFVKPIIGKYIIMRFYNGQQTYYGKVMNVLIDYGNENCEERSTVYGKIKTIEGDRHCYPEWGNLTRETRDIEFNSDTIFYDSLEDCFKEVPKKHRRIK